MIEAVILVVFPFCMAFAAVSDLLSMTIANRVSLLLVATFALVAPMTGMDWTLYAWHFAAFASVLAVTFALFAAGGMGGGDAKLMSATALWMGFGFNLMEYLVTSAVLGGILTIALMRMRASPSAAVVGANRYTMHLFDAKEGIPYGVALGIAGLIVAPNSELMVWALRQLVS